MSGTLYFAYGSNINLNQMAVRCPDAKVVEPAVLEGYEDVYVTVESTCTTSGDGGALLLGGGYDFRVGQLAYVRGPGYMGSGPVTEIERGAEQ